MRREKTKISAVAAKALLPQLQAQAAQYAHKPEQYCLTRLDLTDRGQQKMVVKHYTNGTLYAEAPSQHQCWVAWDKHFGTTAQGDTASKSTPTGRASAIDFPMIGQDESGKGDYFGGLIVAAVLLTDADAKALKALGVQDSKKLTDAQIRPLAQKILDLLPLNAVAVCGYAPAQYNQVYAALAAKKQGLNHLLGGLHAHALEQLIGVNPTVKTAVIDEFAHVRSVTQFLKAPLPTGFNLVTETKAEDRYVAVAAASILARNAFLEQLDGLALGVGERALPLGATHVIGPAKTLLAKHGKAKLAELVKWHFKTTQAVVQS